MKDRILRLGAHEVWDVLDFIDPVEYVTDELIKRENSGITSMPPQVDQFVLTRHPDTGTEVMLVEDLRNGSKCLLPTSSLRELRDAALTTVAARALLASGVVTAAALGTNRSVQLQVRVAAQHLPGVSQVAVFQVGDRDGVPFDRSVLDLLVRLGIDLTFTADPYEAVFGANLLVMTGTSQVHLQIGQVARGAVLVNATGHDLPNPFVHAVDEMYVEDVGLLTANRHRHFVRVHLARQAGAPGSVHHLEGWHGPAGRRGRRVAGDLGEVLTGAHPGRTRTDDILLVELLGMGALDIMLAVRLHQVALDHGVGAWLLE